MPFCCVPRCTSGYTSLTSFKNLDKIQKEEKLKKLSFFQIPLKPEIAEQWCQKIRRSDRPLRKSDRVCSRHFQPEFIIRFYEHKMPDGTICRIERGTPMLQSDAIPTIFPQYPEYYNRKIHKRKSLEQRKFTLDSTASKRKKCQVNSSILSPSVTMTLDSTPSKRKESQVNGSIPSPSVVDLQEEIHDYSQDIQQVDDFSTISNAIIKLPLQWTSVKLQGKEELILMQVNDMYIASKKIIVDKDLNIKIYVEDTKISVHQYDTIQRVKDLQELVCIVDEMTVCPGSVSQEMTPDKKYKCAGFLYKSQLLCFPCKENKKREAYVKKANEKKIARQVHLQKKL